MNENKSEKSPHILNASSNLLGICFVVLTSLKILKLSERSMIDELTTAATILFMASCILSFLAIRSSGTRYEAVADVFFLLGLFTLFGTTVLFSLNVLN